MNRLSYPAFENAARRRRPRVALILGSGLGDLAGGLGEPCELPFADCPGLEATTVPGHRGSLLLGDWAGQAVLLFAGRLHYYEGHPWERVVRPVHVAHALGAEVLVVTNAAGGIRDDLTPGSLLALADHLDWTRPDSGRRREPNPYAPRLLRKMQDAAAGLGFTLPAGVYAQVTGPSYETKAEIRALRACGADAVGMSTAREVQAGRELGLECVALSCVTNRAAGLSDGPINHAEVLTTAALLRERLAGLLEAFLVSLAK